MKSEYYQLIKEKIKKYCKDWSYEFHHGPYPINSIDPGFVPVFIGKQKVNSKEISISFWDNLKFEPYATLNFTFNEDTNTEEIRTIFAHFFDDKDIVNILNTEKTRCRVFFSSPHDISRETYLRVEKEIKQASEKYGLNLKHFYIA